MFAWYCLNFIIILNLRDISRKSFNSFNVAYDFIHMSFIKYHKIININYHDLSLFSFKFFYPLFLLSYTCKQDKD